MLTCLASESTSLAFLASPPQLLRMGERGARLWFHCTWAVRQLSLLLPPLSQPHATPCGTGMAGKHPHLPLGPLLCHQPGRADSVWEQVRDKWVTGVNAGIASEGFSHQITG